MPTKPKMKRLKVNAPPESEHTLVVALVSLVAILVLIGLLTIWAPTL